MAEIKVSKAAVHATLKKQFTETESAVSKAPNKVC